ncbi:MAG: amino acid adenylation domain-containing protein, partial [Pseudomonadota bacterium]
MRPAIDKAQIQSILPLSPTQAGLLFHSVYTDDARAYHEQAAWGIHGPLDSVRFREAWRQVLDRHEVLRTVFIWQSNAPARQLVLRPDGVTLPWCEEDGAQDGLERNRARLDEYLTADRANGFDLKTAPLMRLWLRRVAVDEYYFVFSHHHLILDGWSTNLLLNDVLEAYATGGLSTPSPPPFGDFVGWLRGRDEEAAGQYWHEALASAAPAAFPSAGVATGDRQAIYRERVVELSTTQTGELEEMARQHNLTTNTVLQGAWGLLISRYTDSRDVIFGVTTSGRPAALNDSGRMVGLFINTLPLRVRLSPERALADWLVDLQRQNSTMRECGYHGLADIRRWASIEDDLPLFESLLVFDNFPTVSPESGSAMDVAIRPLGERDSTVLSRHAAERNHYPLTLVAVPGRQMQLRFAYSLARVSPDWVDDLIERFLSMLTRMVADPTLPVGAMGLTPERGGSPRIEPGVERDAELNANLDANPQLGLESGRVSDSPTQSVVPRGSRGLTEALERHRQTHPEGIALVSSRATLTWGELVARSERVARYLASRGVGRGDVVAVLLPRSVEWVIGLVATWRIGAVFMPFDDATPTGRLHRLFAAIEPSLCVVADRDRDTSLPSDRVHRWATMEGAIDHADTVPNPSVQCDADEMAYILFTSGSTGQPKPVGISHRALNTYVASVTERLDLGVGLGFGWLSNVGTDLGLTGVSCALWGGYRLNIIDDALAQSPDEMARWLRSQSMTHLKIAPTQLGGLFAACTRPQDLLPSHTLILGGEAPPDGLLDRIRELRPDLNVVNHYGPTEATIGVSAGVLRPGDDQIHVGPALRHATLRVVDSDGNTQPDGVPGELMIGGVSVARGYLNQPGLTAARFLPDRNGMRIYRTGDRAIQRRGTLHILGRSDGQLSVNGFRVEPGDIESILSQQPGIAQAVVDLIREDDRRSGDRLAAFVVLHERPEAGATPALDSAALVDVLREQLPSYMVPQSVSIVDALPITASGKLDRAALAALQAPPSMMIAHRAPEGPVETALVAIWQDVLACEPISVDDDFFSLGGDSILSLQIVARARREGLRLTPKDLFDNPTIATLASVARGASASEPTPRSAPSSTATIPLTPIQQWFFGQPIPNRHHWNQSIALTLNRDVDVTQIEQALSDIVRCHDAFRLRFRCTNESESRWEQSLAPSASIPVTPIIGSSNRARDLSAACRAAQTGLDITNGPIARAVFADRTADSPPVLCLFAHHLVVDAVSWRIVVDDLMRCARGESLTRAPVNWREWATRLTADVDPPVGRTLKIDASNPGPLPALDPLPVDRPGRNTEGVVQAEEVSLSTSMTNALLRDAGRVARASIDDVVISALVESLHHWTGRDEFAIEREGHGRDRLELDVSRTVGWFTVRRPVVIKHAHGLEDLIDHVLHVKEQLRAAPTVSAGAIPAHLTYNNLGQIMRGVHAEVGEAQLDLGPTRDPDAERATPLALAAVVQEGVLKLTMRFSSEQFESATIAQLCERVRRALERRAVAIAGATRAYVSASDFPASQLSTEALRELALPYERIADLYPFSPLQAGLYFHSLAAPLDGVYVNQLGGELSDVEWESFIDTWRELQTRHDALRTVVVTSDSTSMPLQAVYRDLPLPVRYLDWSDKEPADFERDFAALWEDDRGRGFAEPESPLWRLTLVQRDARDIRFIWCRHHSLLDGWCSSQLLSECLAIYRAKHEGRVAALPRAGRYRNYIDWLAVQDIDSAKTAWRDHLKAYEGATSLPFDASRRWSTDDPSSPASRFAVENVDIDGRRSAQMLERCRALGVTLNSVCQAAWALLLSRHARAARVTFGVTVAGRPADLSEIEHTVGLFINTIPFSVEVPADARTDEWVQSVQRQSVDLRQYEYCSLTDIRQWIGAPTDRELFESVVVFENYPVEQAVRDDPALVASNVISHEYTHYPLTLVITPGRTLRVSMQYDTRRFDAESIKALLEQLGSVIEEMTAGPARSLGNYDVVLPAERVSLLAASGVKRDYAVSGSVVDALRSVCARGGAGVAARSGDETLSYAGLWDLSGRVRDALLSR